MNVWVGDDRRRRSPAGDLRHDRGDPPVLLGRTTTATWSTSQDTGGDENWHLHVVDLETGDDRDVTPFDGVQAHVLGISRRRPGHILVGLNKDNPQLHDAYLLDLETGKLDRAAQNPGYYAWLVDNELRPRGGMRIRDDGSGTFELDGATLLELDADDAISTRPIGFTADDSTLYVITPARRTPPASCRSRPARRPRRSPTTRPTTSPRPSSTRSPAPSRS